MAPKKGSGPNKGSGTKKSSGRKKNNERIKMSDYQRCVKMAVVAASEAIANKVHELYICGHEKKILYVGELEKCPTRIHKRCTWGDLISI